MRTCRGHDYALGKQVHAALQHISALGTQLVQPCCQPAGIGIRNVRDCVMVPDACQAPVEQDQGKQLSSI